MTAITLYAAPGSCARVPCIALEEVGLTFDYQTVVFMKGQHKSPEYRRLNPKGKVPYLVIDEEALTENVAILSYLNLRFPEAQLMPPAASDLERMRHIADLSFVASTLHPIVTRIRVPHFFATADAARSVHETGCKAMHEYFELIEERLNNGLWWYGSNWSVMDAYLYWVHWRVTGAGFPAGAYPLFNEHAARSEERPAVQRALAREQAAQRVLESEGLAFKPPPLPDN